MIIQLDPPIPLRTPIGNGSAFLLIDYSEEHNLFFVVADDATGQIWTWPNHRVRFGRNITMGRLDPETPE